jgi:hypothetical protein
MGTFLSSRGYVPAESVHLRFGPSAPPRALANRSSSAFTNSLFAQAADHPLALLKVRVNQGEEGDLPLAHALLISELPSLTMFVFYFNSDDKTPAERDVAKMIKLVNKQAAALQAHVHVPCSGFVVAANFAANSSLRSPAEYKTMLDSARPGGWLSSWRPQRLLLLSNNQATSALDVLRKSVFSLPQLDAIVLRCDGSVVFGRLVGFLEPEDPSVIAIISQQPAPQPTTSSTSNSVNSPVRALDRIAVRERVAKLVLEHETGGVLGVPVALATGLMGWRPLSRVHAVARETTTLQSVDVPPNVRVKFVTELGGVVITTLNDLAQLRLARTLEPESASSAPTLDLLTSLGAAAASALLSTGSAPTQQQQQQPSSTDVVGALIGKGLRALVLGGGR